MANWMETDAVTSALPMVTGVDCLAMPPTSAAMAISAEHGSEERMRAVHG